MRLFRSFLSFIIGVLCVYLCMFGTALFMESSWSEHRFFTGMGLWYLLAIVFSIGLALRFASVALSRWEDIIGNGLLWGARLLNYWLAITIIITVLLRLDFSIHGVAHALFFFLWPAEFFLLRMGALYATLCTFLGLLFLMTAIGVSLQLRGQWGKSSDL